MNIIGSHKCEGLQSDPSECQSELDDMTKIAEVNFMSMLCIGRPLWDLCECQAEFADIAKISGATVSFCHVDKK